MSVTKDDVKQIAELSKLYFNDNELESMRKDMDALVAFADTLSSLDTKHLEPLSHVQKSENVFDEDIEGEKHDLQELLGNAPESVNNCFVVPKVVE
ncbi:MAG: Asp-tRNA(Asn)/Glu-tRNA(Gln) amidotransferase subunit GatC [Clostridiales bacterium]|nr:Asp-tRNA(Asn)/Glu-tRNA(Gln) amidotransferase subunit GatC [Clostridiales bacterium]